MNSGRAAALEELVRSHLFPVTDSKGLPLGTAFAVGGGVLTCAHVVGARTPDELRVGDRRVLSLVVGRTSDAAFLRLDHDVGGLALGRVRPDAIVVAGYPVEDGLTGPLLTISRIEGSGAIEYAAHGSVHRPAEVWTMSGVLASPGVSGGPVVDSSSGAVVGITVANFGLSQGMQGPAGFMLPIATVFEDEALRERLLAAEAGTARFGSLPNLAAALSWTRAATGMELARMSEEGLFDGARTVPRKFLDNAVDRFLGGNSRVFALVDRSGLGKSTALASIAERIVDRPVVFLRALEVDGPSTGLTELLRRQLELVKPPYASGIPDLDALAAASELAPLVIIDGINEARIGDADLRDRWLPKASAEAQGCKLLLSSRPETWEAIKERVPARILHPVDEDQQDGRLAHGIGEYSEDEQRAFVLDRFGSELANLKGMRNPLLLELAAQLRDEVDGRAVGRWRLMARWIERDCGRAADYGVASARVVEDTLVRVAEECLRLGTEVAERSWPVTREPAFDALIKQHLILREGSQFGFRYDTLFEHLAARSLSVDSLELSGNAWSHEGVRVGWSIVIALCDRLAVEASEDELERMWELLAVAPADAGSNIIRCVAALPVSAEEEAEALTIIERAACDRFCSFAFVAADVAAAEWRPKFGRAVLRIAVRAASGYDFRENDLSNEIRFWRSERQFEIQGFRTTVKSLLERDHEGMLATLREWNLDEEKLGVISGDTTLESTIGSWVSCCFVYCAHLLTDDELTSVPSPRKSGAVFRGLAFSDPSRLLRLARSMAAADDVEPLRLRAVLGALHDMAEDVPDGLNTEFSVAACELALARFDDLDDTDFQSRALAWCAPQEHLRARGWALLVDLAEANRAESVALQAFLLFQPDEVISLAKRVPDGFATLSGSVMLDLAKSSYENGGGVTAQIAAVRMAILREHIAENGFLREAANAVEDLLYVFTPEQAEEVGLVELAFELIRAGTVARAIVYCAGDQNGQATGGRLDQIDRLARGFAEQCPDRDVVELLLMLRLMRAWRMPDVADALVTLGELASASATRFGPGILVKALRSTGRLYEVADATTLERVLAAFRGSCANTDLDALIDRILVGEAD